VGEIAWENVEAMQVVYAASMLEETRLFDIADRLVELWASGILPVGPRVSDTRTFSERYRTRSLARARARFDRSPA
jgi:hypothetical protein